MTELLFSNFQNVALIIVGLIAAVFGVQSWSRGRKAVRTQQELDKATLQVKSLKRRDEAQANAQEAARGVPKPKPVDPKKRVASKTVY